MPPPLISHNGNNNHSSFTDPRSVFPLNLSSQNNNEDDRKLNNGNDGASASNEQEVSVKSSSIADLRMKAKRHQEALGINDSN